MTLYNFSHGSFQHISAVVSLLHAMFHVKISNDFNDLDSIKSLYTKY